MRPSIPHIHILLFPSQVISERAFDQLQFNPQPGTSSGAGRFRFASTVYANLDSDYGSGNIHRTAHWQAQSLYRCWLSCKDPFPSSLTQEDWVKAVWREVCYRTEVHPSPNLLRRNEEACLFFLSNMAQLYLDFQFKCSSIELFNDMKTKIKSAVESLYEFDTSQAPKSISRNARHAQALLADTTFIYRVNLIVSHL